MGNAPSADSSTFSGCGQATAYYVAGTTGWGSTFYGIPTGLWLPSSYGATAMAHLVSGVVVNAKVTDGGYGYTNTPLVRFIGGGGSGAQGVAVVSNRVIIAVHVLDAGYGYTSTPTIFIEPPFIPNPILSIAPMSFLIFSNLTLGGVYQLQQSVAWYWTNLPVSFTATNDVHTQMVAGVVSSGDYRLALDPVPPAATISPLVLPVMRLDSTNLAPYDNYQVQFTSGLGATWSNWNGGLFSSTSATNSQYLFIPNGVGFFRLQYVP
jgi:hypothetical protein